MILNDAVTKSVEMLVDGAGALLFDGVVSNTISSKIVGLKGSGSLGMTHVIETVHSGLALLALTAAIFGFGGRGNTMFYDTSRIEDDSIVAIKGGRGSMAKVEVVFCMGACLQFVQVACIAVDTEDHVVFVIGGLCIGMSSIVIE